MQIRNFLNQPFDYLSSYKNKWFYILFSAFFVLVFLILFQPYGISEEVSSPINPLKNVVLFFVSISANTFVTLSLSQFFLRKWLGFEYVTKKKYIIWFLIEALLLTLVNFGMSFIVPDLGNDFEEELSLVFQMELYFKAIVILLFPFTASIIYFLIQNLNSEIHELGEQLVAYKQQFNTRQKSELLRLKDENENPDFSIELKDFLYTEASNQYILVHYLKNGQEKKHIIRNRMKNFLNQTSRLPIKQCHRSYAVNLLNVEHKKKIAGKDFLILSGPEAVKVPISKSYTAEINNEVFHKV